MKSPKRKPSMAARATAALARDGMNTLLLNLQQGLDSVRLDTASLNASMGYVVKAHEEAKESRKQMLEKLGDLGEGQASMTERVSNLEVTVNKIGATVDKHEALYQQHLGKKNFIASLKSSVTPFRVMIVGLFGTGGALSWLHLDRIVGLFK